MGTWGVGIFDNDDAGDWSWQLTESGLSAVEDALRAALDSDYVEAPTGVCALAAADVVARLVSGRGDTSASCEDVAAWVASNPGRPDSSLVALAAAAAGRVCGDDSELKELWAEQSDTFGQWLATVDDVLVRLQS